MADNTNGTSTIVKAKDVGSGRVVGATEVPGKFGPQLRLRLEDGRTTFVKTTSGIAKGLANGKLVLPINVSTQVGYGPKGRYVFLGLAPRMSGPAPTAAPTPSA